MAIAAGALLVSWIFPLATYFFLRGAHEGSAEYQRDCRNLLWNGALLGFPVFGFSLLCNILFSLTRLSEKYPFLYVLFSAFVLKALSEELMKYLLARRIIRRNRANVSFLDLMAYTAISAVGFELMESVVYLFSSNVPQILVRGITNMHAAFGLIMGYFIALGYKKDRKMPALPGILVSTLLHGLYDLGLDQTLIDTFMGGLSLLLAVFCLGVNIANFFFMSKARKDPCYTDPLFPEQEAQ